MQCTLAMNSWCQGTINSLQACRAPLAPCSLHRPTFRTMQASALDVLRNQLPPSEKYSPALTIRQRKQQKRHCIFSESQKDTGVALMALPGNVTKSVLRFSNSRRASASPHTLLRDVTSDRHLEVISTKAPPGR